MTIERLERLEQQHNDSDMQIYRLLDEVKALKARIVVLEGAAPKSMEEARARQAVADIYTPLGRAMLGY